MVDDPVPAGVIAAVRADLARNADRGPLERLVVVIVRLGQHVRGPARVAWILADRIVLRLLLGAEISRHARFGPGLAFPHAARGVIIHPGVVVGDNCRIFPRVTLADHDGGAPILEDDVTVWSGAAVLGPVSVGSRAVVGANSVVLGDVPAGASVLGVPARRVPRGPRVT